MSGRVDPGLLSWPEINPGTPKEDERARKLSEDCGSNAQVPEARKSRIHIQIEKHRSELTDLALECRHELQAFIRAPTPQVNFFNEYASILTYFWRPVLKPMLPILPLSEFSSAVVRLGGIERISLLIRTARFDKSLDGELDAIEEEAATKEAEKVVADGMTNYTNTAVVAALLFGASHSVTIARPNVLQASELFLQDYTTDTGVTLTWLAYGCNMAVECMAIGALLLSFFYRNMLAMALPSLADKLRFMIESNATGTLTSTITGMFLSLWLTAIFGAILGQPRWGWLGVGGLSGTMAIFVHYTHHFMLGFPIRLQATARRAGLKIEGWDGQGVSAVQRIVSHQGLVSSKE